MIGLADELPAPCRDHLRNQTMPELWQPIKGYEGLYEVSDQGRVRSLERKARTYTGFRRVRGRILKELQTPYGYLTVMLYNSNTTQRLYVHRLVASVFCANPQQTSYVLHGNDIKTDNRASNLRWGTHQQNVDQAVASERHAHGESVGNSKLKEVQVLAIRQDPRPHKIIAAEYGVATSNIGAIKRRETWAHLTVS